MPELDLGNVKGPQGKSAYQSALDAGYSGSEEAFNTAMAKAPDAVLYTAQTLTDEQKAQARGNINAAPGGYGSGDYGKMLTADDDLNTLTVGGHYLFFGNSIPKNAPTGLNDWTAYVIENLPYNELITAQILHIIVPNSTYEYGRYTNCSLRRTRYGNDYTPWAWTNPPMELGVEYCITERYFGKTVYTQVFKAFDSLAKGGSVYDAPIQNVSQIISCTGESGGWSLPSDVIGGEVAGDFIHIGTQRGSTVVQVYAITNRENWAAPVYVTLKYTKTTD